jgi:hypothetical protein
MKLLGIYKTNLQAFHYEELLALFKLAIQSGEFSGQRTFDEAAIVSLVQQAQDFDTLPLSLAGQRVTDDCLNTPLSLLRARFTSLVSEAADFDQRAASLLSVLEKDSSLLDQLLAAASLEAWVDSKPPVTGADTFAWDFGVGHGKVASDIDPTDPVNAVEYALRAPLETHFDTTNGETHTGLATPMVSRNINVKSLTWHYTTTGQKEELFGDQWTKLSLLEDRPLLNFVPDPRVDVILPLNAAVSGIFEVQGSVLGGALPIFVRTLFHPRRTSIQITPYNALQNGDFEAGATGWTTGTGWTIGTSPTPYAGSKGASVSGTGSGPLTSGQLKTNGINAKVQAGDNVYIEAQVNPNGSDGSLQIILSCLDSTNTEIKAVGLLPITPGAAAWQKVSGIVVVPDGVTRFGAIKVQVTGQTVGAWKIDNIRAHLPQQVSPYVVLPDEVQVYTPKIASEMANVVYFSNVDFVVDGNSNVTFLGLDDSTELTVRFSEFFPAFQCSINETDWSTLRMFDPARPYPDDETKFQAIDIVDGAFPVTDELGVPTGLTIKMVSKPVAEYVLQVSTPALPNYGATAVLEVEFERPAYMNGFNLVPFTTFPARLTTIAAEDFSSDTRQTLYSGSGVVLDRSMVLRFPRRLVRRIFLTFYQENYSLKEHTVDSGDKLRRDILASLQPILPFSVQRISKSLPQRFRGAQYEFGVEHLVGLDSTPSLPGVFVSGPYQVLGCPEVIRLDADIQGTVDLYLCFRAFDGAGTVKDVQLQGTAITPGSTIVFPFADTLDRGQVDHTDVYVKAVNRTSLSLLKRFVLQITKV